jgi:hypothetical protein
MELRAGSPADAEAIAGLIAHIVFGLGIALWMAVMRAT